jgi:hypothetical protein
VELRIDPPDWQGSSRADPDFRILNMPDGNKYDALLFGGPVWGFSASPVILKCIKGMEGLKGKKVLPFITQGFPFAGLGGKRALGQMVKEAAGKGADVLPGRSAQKMFHDMEKMMRKAASEVMLLF